MLSDTYRPYEFEDVLGSRQQSAVAALKGSMMDPKGPAGSYLLTGPHGTGKTTLARIFARKLNCYDPSTCSREKPCDSCEAVMDKNHADILEMNAAVTRGIEDVRALVDRARFYATNKFRVFIIDEIQQLTNQAQQALLKSMEEPNKTTLWVLCSMEPDKILGAIKSRCMQMSIGGLTDPEMSTLLTSVAVKENIQLPPEIQSIIIEASAGHARDALNTLTQYQRALLAGNGNLDIANFVQKVQSASPVILAFKYVAAVCMNDPGTAFVSAGMVEGKTRFFEDVVQIIRGLLYRAVGADQLVRQNPYADRIMKAKSDPSQAPLYVQLLQLHLEAVATLKSYTMPENDVVELTAAKSLLLHRR